MNQEMKQGAHRFPPEQLMAYLDGELPREEMESVAAHLEDCVRCQMLAVEFSEASAKMQAWRIEAPEILLSPRVAEALRTSLEKPAAQPGFGQALLKLVTLQWIQPVYVRPVAFGAAAVAAFAVFVLSPRLVLHRQSIAPAERAEIALPAPAQMADRSSERATSLEQPGILYDRPAPAVAGTPYQPSSATSTSVVTESEALSSTERPAAPALSATSRMLVRTGRLVVTTKQFDQARDGVNLTLARYQGYFGVLRVNAPPGAGRILEATLRVPTDRLDAALADLKRLGHVDSESMSGDEVSQQYVDLVARLANARKTEQRLNDLILTRTGKISDVLEVERYRSETRGEIERMEAERKNLENQVQFSTLQLTINEEYKAALPGAPSSSGNELWNAAVRGYTRLVNSILAVSTTILAVGPALLLWCVVLGIPIYWARKRWLQGKAH